MQRHSSLLKLILFMVAMCNASINLLVNNSNCIGLLSVCQDIFDICQVWKTLTSECLCVCLVLSVGMFVFVWMVFARMTFRVIKIPFLIDHTFCTQ